MSTVDEFTAASLAALDMSSQINRIAEQLDTCAQTLRRLQGTKIPYPDDTDGIVLPPAVANAYPLDRHALNLEATALMLYGHAGAWNREGRAIANSAPAAGAEADQ